MKLKKKEGAVQQLNGLPSPDLYQPSFVIISVKKGNKR
jgi:hypothetical protein